MDIFTSGAYLVCTHYINLYTSCVIREVGCVYTGPSPGPMSSAIILLKSSAFVWLRFVLYYSRITMSRRTAEKINNGPEILVFSPYFRGGSGLIKETQ